MVSMETTFVQKADFAYRLSNGVAVTAFPVTYAHTVVKYRVRLAFVTTGADQYADHHDIGREEIALPAFEIRVTREGGRRHYLTPTTPSLNTTSVRDAIRATFEEYFRTPDWHRVRQQRAEQIADLTARIECSKWYSRYSNHRGIWLKNDNTISAWADWKIVWLKEDPRDHISRAGNLNDLGHISATHVTGNPRGVDVHHLSADYRHYAPELSMVCLDHHEIGTATRVTDGTAVWYRLDAPGTPHDGILCVSLRAAVEIAFRDDIERKLAKGLDKEWKDMRPAYVRVKADRAAAPMDITTEAQMQDELPLSDLLTLVLATCDTTEARG